jgi:DNA-binding MarR family transcriptional regulator
VRNLTGRLLDDALRSIDVTADEFGLYSLIYSFGPVTQTQISRWTGMAPTTVSGMVRRITSRGHVRDMPNPDDARSRMVYLSDDGVDVTLKGAGILATLAPRLGNTLHSGETAVRAGLRDLDTALRQLLDAAPRPYPGPATRPATAASVTYEGSRLTEAQSGEVRMFINWIRARDKEGTPGATP